MPTSPRTTARVAKALTPFAATLLVVAFATTHVPLTHAQATLTRITGTASTIFPFGGGIDATFTCETAPGSLDPCIGTYRSTVRFTQCSNKFQLAGPVTITGLVAQPGPIQGTITYAENDFRSRIEPDGTCTFIPGSFATIVDRYTGTWDGSRGFVTMSERPGAGWFLTSSFFVDRNVPVFPLAVTGKIDGKQANASATLQFRTQDVGTTGNVYVFALAPANLVTGAQSAKRSPIGLMAQSRGAPLADAVPCVLAQLNASGQLQAVSAANLQAYVTGVLSGQGQAVTVMNGVPTVNIAGATFYVGYGASSASMINGGLNRNVIGVSGALECHPQTPQTGWWWNTAEGGRGYSIEAAGNHLFFAAYLYDGTGRATWLVAAGNTSLDGSLFVGRLESYSGGQTLTGAYRAPNPVSYVGDITLAFNTTSHGTLVWPGGTIPIERFNIVPNGLAIAPRTGQPEAGWWWNPNESGRGFFLEWQGGQLFMAGYMYDASGNPIWYLSTNTTPATNLQSYSNTWLQYANGQTLGGAYRPPVQINTNVGPVTIQFQGATTGIMTLPGGRTSRIERFRF